MTTTQRIKSNPKVRDVSDERGIGDGFWVYLKDHHTCDGVHAIHEDTPEQCLRELKHIVPCTEKC